MVRQYYRRRLHLRQARPTRRPSKDGPLRRRSRGERWEWGGSAGERVSPYRLPAVGIRLLAALLIAFVLSGTVHGNDELVQYRIVDGTIPEPLTAQPGDPERGRRIVLDRDGGD